MVLEKLGFQLEGNMCANLALENSSSEEGNQGLMSMTLHLRGLSKPIPNSYEYLG